MLPHQHAAEFRRCLEQLDVRAMRKLWAHVSPHLPQPNTDEEILVTLHHARTRADSISLRQRAYSHAWLRDGGHPSGLPDHLKQPAERLYPRVVTSVGISVNTHSELLKPIMLPIRDAMEGAVQEVYADGGQDDIPLLRSRMSEARRITVRKLLGV